MLESPTIESLTNQAEPVLREHLSQLEASSETQFRMRHEREAALTECLNRLELRHVKDSRAVYLQLEDEGGLPSSEDIEGQVNHLDRRIRELEPAGRVRSTS